MSTRVEVEDIQTTKSEKLLAWILAAFMLVAGVWTYQKLDDVAKRRVSAPKASTADSAALERESHAIARVYRAQSDDAAARRRMEDAREAYRTELDAGRRAPVLAARYRSGAAAYAAAKAELRAAQAERNAASADARLAHRRQARAYDRYRQRLELVAFATRLLFFAAALGGAYLLMARMRRRGSRYFVASLATVGAAALMAVVLAGDYVTDYVNPLDYGVLLLALFGIALTLVAFWALQRYLAQRVPHRRVRKHECPFCGYPVAANRRCEGCGREVIGACTTCAQPRRVGTRFCGACGAT